jgi:hypothetical protein
MMRKEYDFPKGERGKFYRPGIQLNLPIYLEPDLRKYFPDAESVNKALRCLLPLLSPKKNQRHPGNQ